MKNLLYILAFICLVGQAQNRIPYRAQKVFFDGNSLTNLSQGNLDNGYRVAIKTMSLVTGRMPVYHCVGIRGRRTDSLAFEFPTKIAPIAKTNDIVVLWEICNSAHDNIGDVNGDTIYAKVVNYCNVARSYGLKVIVVTGIARDVTGGGLDDANITNRIFAANAQIRANWASFCDGIADPALLSQFDNKTDVSNATYYNADRVHLTDVGYDLIAGTIQPVLQPLIQQ